MGRRVTSRACSPGGTSAGSVTATSIHSNGPAGAGSRLMMRAEHAAPGRPSLKITCARASRKPGKPSPSTATLRTEPGRTTGLVAGTAPVPASEKGASLASPRAPPIPTTSHAPGGSGATSASKPERPVIPSNPVPTIAPLPPCVSLTAAKPKSTDRIDWPTRVGTGISQFPNAPDDGSRTRTRKSVGGRDESTYPSSFSPPPVCHEAGISVMWSVSSSWPAISPPLLRR